MGSLAMDNYFGYYAFQCPFTCALKYSNDSMRAIILVFLFDRESLPFLLPHRTISADLHHRALRLRTSFLQLDLVLQKGGQTKTIQHACINYS
jgi:hypothetical protein